jgi:hypothetical protein
MKFGYSKNGMYQYQKPMLRGYSHIRSIEIILKFLKNILPDTYKTLHGYSHVF